jgi:adenylosuccinate synthase
VYEVLQGWTEELSGVRAFEDLPKAAQEYVLALEELSGARISAVGVGPARDQTVVRHSLLP